MELKDVGEYCGGGTPETSKESYWTGNIPWISSSDIQDDNILSLSKSRFITKEAVEKSATKLIPKGSILMVSRVGVGKFAVADEDLCTSQDFTNLITTENEYFLGYYFKSRANRFVRLSQGTSIKGFTTNDIKSAKFLIPHKDEQSKVASFLNIIEERIQTQIKIIEHQESLIKGLMQDVFIQQIRFKDDDGNEYPDWEEKKLNEVAKYYDGTHQTPKYIESGVPFYSVEHVTANQFSKTKFISQEVFEKENKRVKLEKGDILMTRIGSIGVAKYIDWDVNASFYVSLALIKSNISFNSQFLAFAINHQYFQKELWRRTIHVAFPQKINLGEIGECTIKLPTLLEQTKIANFLSSLDAKLEKEKQLLEQYQQQKKYLLQNLFI